MKTMNASMAALFAIALTCQTQAANVTITSPTQGDTRSDSSIFSRGLHWNERSQKLTAVITFSNQDYVLQADPREDDTFAFALPGVRYDATQNVFYAVSRDGRRTPIAKYRRLLLGKEIELLPGATVVANKNHGHITVKLKVTDAPPSSAPHWIEVSGSSA